MSASVTTIHEHLSVTNLVLLRGHLSSAPRVRSLPSGSELVQLEITTSPSDASPACSVPVVWFDPPARSGIGCATPGGTEVVVAGHVRRRYFRAGGVTQSRTEVVAATVVPTTRVRTVERVVAGVIAALGADHGGDYHRAP